MSKKYCIRVIFQSIEIHDLFSFGCRWTEATAKGYFDNTFLHFVISQAIDHDREWGEGRRAAEYIELSDDNTRGD